LVTGVSIGDGIRTPMVLVSPILFIGDSQLTVALDLANTTVGVMEDRFDVEGKVTGFGNPDWVSTHEPATRTAPAVNFLVDAGATCVGKLHMDELAYRYSLQVLQRWNFG